MLSLFREYPLLGERLPHIPLGEFPTPVEELPRLGAALGIGNLYIKRDDLSGGVYGGNKVRKLEFLLGETVRDGAKEVMTFGAAGSNHALATAIYARQAGLKSISMLTPQPNARYVRRNLLMSHAVGAELHHYPGSDALREGTNEQLRFHRGKSGALPRIIPLGGTTLLGTSGFVNAAFELRDQIRSGLLPEPDHLYVALGSMGTADGLFLGLLAAGLRTRMHAVRVVAENIANPDTVHQLFQDTNTLLHSADPTFPLIPFSFERFELHEEFFGERYALFTPEGVEAIHLMQREEGVSLDGTYTGKTFAALIRDARNGELRGKTALFWNTLNSRDFSGSIENIDYHELPESLHGYFEEDVQPLDR